MKQILVATDFSKCAANAMAYAMELAKILDREVCAIHAIHPTEGINNSTYNAIFIEDYYHAKREALKEWVRPFTGDDTYNKVKVTTLCDIGFLKTVITKHIDNNPVDLLVMGIMGATGITGIVGSNASMMVSKVKIPTLIVPLESKFARVPVITLATDFETRLSAVDVYALNEMVKAFGSAKMQVLYVSEDKELPQAGVWESRLADLINPTELEFNYIRDSSALNGIMKFIESHGTDMLCLVKHHHNIVYRLFARSTVNQVMNKSVKAILVLHE
ncbi:nucleotide-binding universal stress UspA family protein [Mucilaginibacter oryzae]|uniref:Nucleotide-binding universal stress UspA family protein n=1 Tax=Mucilaginibacter oryzae TaxID=468058 RepID=A0A316H7F3_9SPHI|nr:universal stress protein [Mucilaginibacter oryzae]PWK75901.1 nucleotide-binding universal stress UspA family protein [Mucilaginibacter oryzae]